MVELITTYTLFQVPYIHDDALEEFAEEILLDFSPEILTSPQPFDYMGFAQRYLGLKVEYRRLAYDRKMLGVTAFNAGYIQVINARTGLREAMEVGAGTVVIDPLLRQKRNWPRFRFTLTHEGCHWIAHRKAFSPDNPAGSVGIYENRYIAAKEGRADYSRSRKDKTSIDRIERQADFLTSAIVMPKITLRMAYCDFFKENGVKPWSRIIRGRSEGDDIYAKMLPVYIGKRFEVSKHAALIRLEKLNAIVDKPFKELHKQAGGT